MAISVMIMGESGTGKSTSIRTLNPAETYLLSAIDKPLPFRNKYKKDWKETPGNLFITDDHELIIKSLAYISEKRPEIKNIVVDDFQYIMANEYMRRAKEKGYEKFTELATKTWSIIDSCKSLRQDLAIFFLTHSEEKDGRYKAKTMGKMLDEKITLEGLFTIVLHSQISEGKYLFLTQNDGYHIAKSPVDMFESKYINNDLNYVKEKIDSYYTFDDIPQ